MERICIAATFIVAILLALMLAFLQGAWATDLNGQWDNSPNAAWYKAQKLTPETARLYALDWGSCCDHGDVCQECIVHRQQNEPPFSDTWWYEKSGKAYELPPHIVEYVPWTPTGKPVLFLAPFDAGKIHQGDPMCLKVPGGQT